MQSSLSYTSITPHMKTLRALGFYHIDSSAPKLNKYLHKIYMAFIFIFIIIYTGQEMMKVYQFRHNADKVMETMFLMLTYSDALYKMVLMWIKREEIEKLVYVLKGPLFNQHVPEHQVHLIQRGRDAMLILQAINIAALSTCFLWVIYPVIQYAQSNPVEFQIWLPIDPNKSPQFYVALGYVWVQTSLLAVGNMSMDAFISHFFAQSKTQLSILRIDLETIVQKSQDEAKTTSIPFDQIFHRRFHKITLHYNEIVQLCENTQTIFGGMIFYFFLVGGWIICTSAYRMVNISPLSIQFLSMILYVTCILTEIYLYCYYGNEVAYESDKLMESAFAMDWYKLPYVQRRSLLVFMERIKRPIAPMAGGIIPLSKTTFISILRSSYTFYAFLKNSDK